jgi:hypothetical protein
MMRPATGEHFASGQETSADRRTAWWAREGFRNLTNSMAYRVPLCRVVPFSAKVYFRDCPTTNCHLTSRTLAYLIVRLIR